MFVDASAIVAILDGEPGWQQLSKRISDWDGPVYVSSLVRFEAAQAIARLTSGGRKPASHQLGLANDKISRFFDDIGAQDVAIGEDIGQIAIQASMRYGKAVGHAADLNFGDCFAYACARARNVPLLYKGEDFTHTDLA